MTLTKVPTRIFWMSLLFATLYLSYRYPFQINSAGTSPTYSDTPASLQVVKFLFILAMSAISCIFLIRKRFSWTQIVVCILAFFLAVFSALKALGTFDPIYFDIAFWPSSAFILVAAIKPVSFRQLDKYFLFVFACAVISTFVQFYLFIAYGRLPALAYSNSLSVRFGGFLDDPNGFAAILFLLMGWAFFRFGGLKRVASETLLIICLLLTQSFTAFAFLFLLIAILLGLFALKNPIKFGLFFWGLPVVAILSSYLLSSGIVDLVTILVGNKSNSISDHLDMPLESWIYNWHSWILFGNAIYNHYESWWVTSLVNFGIFWYLINLTITLLLAISVFRAISVRTHGPRQAVLGGIGLFCLYMIGGSVNLPLLVIFPINFLFYIFCYLVFLKKIEDAPLELEHL
ncbi:MAG: hypothetical protein ACYC46_08230 [Acidobacteriaceae bacterium]